MDPKYFKNKTLVFHIRNSESYTPNELLLHQSSKLRLARTYYSKQKRELNQGVKDTSASRRPILLSDVVNKSIASDGDEVSIVNLSSSSTRKLTLHS